MKIIISTLLFLTLCITNKAQNQSFEIKENTKVDTASNFHSISGINAASGLLFQNDKLYVISDNSNYLYISSIQKNQLEKRILIKSKIKDNLPKKIKSDFESITSDKDYLYIFGSGSSPKRQSLIKWDKINNTTKKFSLKKLYSSLKKRFDVSNEDFNIEGALILNDELWLFNRGNGPSKKNGIFIVDNIQHNIKSFHPIPLGELNNVALGFTDAIIYKGTIYFLAAAEGVSSTYHDGEIQGTILGQIDSSTKQLKCTNIISKNNKFEGITLYKENLDSLEFLLCEDPDNNQNNSTIYHIKIKK